MPRAVLLPHAPASVTSARRRLRSDLRASGLDTARVNDAALVLSELLSNALRHASPLPAPFPADSVRVSWTIGADPDDESGTENGTGSAGTAKPGWVEISVCDGGGETLPRVARPSASALGGRGLDIVECIAAKWGAEIDGQTTTVWAMLELPAMQVAEAAAGAADGASHEPETSRA